MNGRGGGFEQRKRGYTNPRDISAWQIWLGRYHVNNGIILRSWRSVRGSYWFIPAVMSLAAIGLAYLMPYLDGLLEGQGQDVPSWIYGGGVQGARSLLSTIAGSMITVASLTFSITLVALSSAAQQYGPRLLTHFMSDRGYQVTLGTFVSTFLYCVLILRQVQDVQGTPVLPRLAVSFAVALAVAALAMLIYFIHHVAASLRPETLVKRIGSDLSAAVKRAVKSQEPGPADPAEDGATVPRHPPTILTSLRAGYIESIDDARLKSLAAQGDLVVRPLRRPGEFVMQGSGLVEVGWPRGPELETGEKIVSAFVFGSDSSPKGDVEIAISQLVEVAVRAVSPSLNNPTTAISCIDKLEAALRQVAEQQADEIGWASADASVTEARAGFQPPHPMFAELLGLSFDEIRHYGRTMPSVVLRLMHALAALSTEVHDELSLDALLEQVELTIRAGQDLPEAKDRRALVELHGELVAGIQRRR